MRYIDQLGNCFSSMTSDEESLDSDANRKKRRRSIMIPFERYALLVFGGGRKIENRDFYSKFYASAAIQPKYFCAGKKYEIERKHKVKKRELLNDKLSNGWHHSTSIVCLADNIRRSESIKFIWLFGHQRNEHFDTRKHEIEKRTFANFRLHFDFKFFRNYRRFFGFQTRKIW